jgi:hypothetical protein
LAKDQGFAEQQRHFAMPLAKRPLALARVTAGFNANAPPETTGTGIFWLRVIWSAAPTSAPGKG